MKGPDDRDIITLIASDSHKGFSELMKRYKEPIYWHIRRMVRNHEDAEDVTQETLVKLFKARETLQTVDNLRAWVYRIATNEALRLIQQREPMKQDVDLRDASTEPIYADEYYDYSDLEGVRLQKAIDTLPGKQKLIFCLRYYDDLPYDEIARIATTSVASAKVCYHLAKAKVIAQLSKHTMM